MMVMPRKRRKPVAEINVVPYIDVMLVLLIIFMVTAPLITQGVKVELPKASSEPLSKDSKPPLVASVDAVRAVRKPPAPGSSNRKIDYNTSIIIKRVYTSRRRQSGGPSSGRVTTARRSQCRCPPP